jgi:GTPase
MMPDMGVVIVGANMGVKRMTREHFGVSSALEIPVVVAVTKIDMCPKNVLKETMQNIKKYLKTAGKVPLVVKSIEEAETAAKTMKAEKLAPIFPISNVTGFGLDRLMTFLSLVELRDVVGEKEKTGKEKSAEGGTEGAEAKTGAEKEADAERDAERSFAQDDGTELTTFDANGPVELPIDATYQVPGVGFVVAGNLVSGTINTNDKLDLGPDHNGNFMSVVVRSIECMYLPVQKCVAGQTISLNIRAVGKKESASRSTFRKGMCLVPPSREIVNGCVTREFQARVVVLHHQTTIAGGYQPMLNCRTVRQSAEIIRIKRKGKDGKVVLRTGDKALVTFRFSQCAELLKKDTRFVFRDGRCKGIGKIVKVSTLE